jgi:phage I-like protein
MGGKNVITDIRGRCLPLVDKTYLAATIAALEGDSATLPDWYTIFAAGEGELEDGPTFMVDEAAWRAVSDDFYRRNIDRVVDYEHQSLTGDKAPAAGWITELRWEGNGIEARIEWTEEAAEYLRTKQYRYFSPVFTINEAGTVTSLQSLALTNTPRTNSLQPLLASLAAAAQNKESTMSNDLRAQLAAALGIDQAASDETVVASIAAIKEQAGTVPEPIISACGCEPGADVSTVVASIHALHQQTRAMVTREEHNALVAKLAERDAGEAVAEAMVTGKVIPDQKEWALDYARRDLDGFTTFVAKAPVVVPVGDLNKPKEPATGAPELSPEVLQVASQMGLAADDLKKYAPKG